MGTRVIVGSLLTLLAVGVFYGDHVIGPPYPFLMAITGLFGLLAAFEIVSLIPSPRKPARWFVVVGTLIILLLNWIAAHKGIAPWRLVFYAMAVVIIVAFLEEMRIFREPGDSLNRIALSVFSIGYLAIFATYFVNLRLRQADDLSGTLALALAVFVPKGCDIGAYFTGSFIGKHRMSPVLSPKKTWEGAIGGFVTAMAVAMSVQAFHPIIPGGYLGAATFGFVVGLVGLMGDLAESLIKRDCGSKDAANLIPSFGGVLDVIDSVLCSAPVVYLWLNSGVQTLE